MFARVATFEGADPSTIDETLEQIRGHGKPENVPASGFLLMLDRESGKVVSVTLFDSEDDLRAGSEALEAMSPPVTGGLGRRTSVETFDVPVQMS